MSQRQTVVKDLALTIIGGVNQRIQGTELQLHEYENIQGAFPEFAGLQSRIPGKRLLAKYLDSIYGIYQFWTPYGYGVGLYQFTDKIDAGQWQTPTTKFPDFPHLPPEIRVNFEGHSENEFGEFDGNPFTAIHQNPVPNVDPSNGGPAGQGHASPDIPFVEPADITLYVSDMLIDFTCIGQGFTGHHWRDVIFFHSGGPGSPVIDLIFADNTPTEPTEWHGITIRRGDNIFLGTFGSEFCGLIYPQPSPPYVPSGPPMSTDRTYHVYQGVCLGREEQRFTLTGSLLASGSYQIELVVGGAVIGGKLVAGGNFGVPNPFYIEVYYTPAAVFAYEWRINKKVIYRGGFDCNIAIETGELDINVGTITYP